MKIKYFSSLFLLLLIAFKGIGNASSCCGYSSPGNNYPCSGGNCTWWSAYKRPETIFPGTGRHAKTWLDRAAANGLPTGSQPKKGSIAVFKNMFPPYGHVAYVEKVTGNSFEVSEMGWKGSTAAGWCGVNRKTYRISDASGFIFPASNSGSGKISLRHVKISTHNSNNWRHDLSFTQGQIPTLDMEIKVKNKGNADAKHIKIKYYLSDDKHFSRHGDIKLDSDEIDKLKKDESEEEHARKLRIINTLSPGTYYFFTCVEYPKKSYNCSSKNDSDEYSKLTILPVKHPDQIVYSINVSNNTMNIGQYFNLITTVQNIGDGDTTNSILKYYLSYDSIITTSDTLISSDRIPVLTSGATLSVNETLTAPSNEGTFWIGACMESIPSEINTTNNCSSAVQISITDPSSNRYRADVNGDGKINSTDSMLTLRYSLGLDMSQTNWHDTPITGDVNCSGVTTTTDSNLLFMKSLGFDMEATDWCLE